MCSTRRRRHLTFSPSSFFVLFFCVYELLPVFWLRRFGLETPSKRSEVCEMARRCMQWRNGPGLEGQIDAVVLACRDQLSVFV